MSLSPLPPQLQRKSLGDQVYESIREGIVSLRLEPGSMIYENELADTLRVSRTPIREAIRLLVSEQLLDVLPQRGTRIAYISQRKAAETRFIREHLEIGAFRVAAKMWNRQDRREVRGRIGELLEGQRAAAEEGDIGLFLQLDEEFHRSIMEVTGNATLLQVVYHMRGHLNRLRFLALKQFHHMDRVIEEHNGLLEAIEQGNEDLTARRLELHVGKLDVELPALREAYPQYFID
ncbi:GntR family transcriptional regulator [Paenibacillus doosanensis]|uniref:HTH-type transcriptional regulator YdfH n=1 Tax=Paenibacillus konkukensis TaxID=2020716 RepID=A0ABY4RLS8_9BACL|nr:MULTISPECIES: GntR family transcriptional regulator [Paenibacillus]MCS7463932.1 GntR family transcriptional regulator [Paenibacillus doosanensis]UQZ82267.1 putative HTH-type transcriptional regulator YdfH [Paenibacillus konkukensis]